MGPRIVYVTLRKSDARTITLGLRVVVDLDGPEWVAYVQQEEGGYKSRAVRAETFDAVVFGACAVWGQPND